MGGLKVGLGGWGRVVLLAPYIVPRLEYSPFLALCIVPG